MLESYGDPGPGRWITVFASGGHAFIEIAGILLDTSRFGAPTMPAGSGPRWQPTSILTAQLQRRKQLDRTTPPGPLRRAQHPEAVAPGRPCLLVIGIAALQPATSSSTRRTRAAAARIPSTTAARPTTRAPKRRGLDARTTAVTFARAYARYLANRLPAERLPTLSPAAAAMVRQSGPLPARLHIRRVQLISVDGARSSWTARFAVIDARGRFVLSAGLLLAPSRAGWELAELVAPDPDILIASPSPAARPVGPDAARDTAMTFTTGYLAYTYGHAGIGQLRGVSSRAARRARRRTRRGCRRPYARVDPRVASLALSPDGRDWLASANVTDGQNTYQVISILGRVHGSWRVIALRSAG